MIFLLFSLYIMQKGYKSSFKSLGNSHFRPLSFIFVILILQICNSIEKLQPIEIKLQLAHGTSLFNNNIVVQIKVEIKCDHTYPKEKSIVATLVVVSCHRD